MLSFKFSLILAGCGEELILPSNGTVMIKSPEFTIDEPCTWFIRSAVDTSHILVKNTDYRVICEYEFRFGTGNSVNVSSTYRRWEFRWNLRYRMPANFSVPSSVIWMSVEPVSSCFVANGSQFVFEFSNVNDSVVSYCQSQLFQCVDYPIECVSHPCDGNAACTDQSDELGLHCRE